jgi:hypothetical protein
MKNLYDFPENMDVFKRAELHRLPVDKWPKELRPKVYCCTPSGRVVMGVHEEFVFVHDGGYSFMPLFGWHRPNKFSVDYPRFR